MASLMRFFFFALLMAEGMSIPRMAAASTAPIPISTGMLNMSDICSRGLGTGVGEGTGEGVGGTGVGGGVSVGTGVGATYSS